MLILLVIFSWLNQPIEIDLGDNVTVNGRIDMVKQVNTDGQKETVIVDFKTANKRVLEEIKTEQLKIYALGYPATDRQNSGFHGDLPS